MDGIKAGWQTSEFWVSIGTLAASVITLLVLFGLIQPQSEQDTVKAVTQVIAAIGAIVIQWRVAATFTASRTAVKVAAIENKE